MTNNNLTTYNVNTGTFNINAEAFSRVGYDFAGLYNNEQHTQPVSLPKTITSGYAAIDKDQTFYASWTANTYTVTLNNQSAMTPGTESVTATYDAAMPAITVPTRTGYTFGGYYTETNGGGTQYYNAEGTSAHNWDIAQATTLYAQWTANTYTVHFDANYDNNGIIISGSMSNQILTYDQGALNACSFTRIGYTFAGWNTQADGSGTTYTDQQASPNITPDNGATVTLYAQWNVINWTGGGTNENDPFVIRYASQLVKLADTVNSGTNGYQYKYFKLGNNIDMNGVAFDGIGNYEHSFNGSFNGDSKIISNVTINITGDDVGFFGDLFNATVKNLVLDGISISGIFHVGVLAGYAHYTSIDSCLVLNSSVSSTQNDYVGIIVGDQNNATLSANYYHGCTFLGTANATNVGVGDTNSYGFHGAYDVAGARSVHTLAVPARVIVSGGETVVIDQVTYYAAGVDVTLAPDASYLTLSDVSVNGTAATPNGDGTWRFTMPAADATVTATVTMESVSYIDENGDMHYCSYYTLIGSNEGDISYGTSNTESWFVVNSNVTINNGKLTLQGSNNHLILCDGATLTITNTSGEALSANGSLTIYCQTQGTGAIVANASENGIYASSFLTINGGVVHAERQACNNNCCGIRSEDKITINGGIVTATSNNYNGYGLCAWQGIILGWTNANDRITVNSYYNQYIGIKIKDGQSLWNGSEALSGTITSLSKLNGKTLVPCTPVSRKYVRITSFDQLTDGSKVIIAARYDNVHTHGYYAMPGEAFAQPTGVAFTSETSGNDEILPATITASEDTYYWTVNMEGEYYTFKNANGHKIGCYDGINESFNSGININWTIARETAEGTAMVANYTGFVIRNVQNDYKAFAFNGTKFVTYYTPNMSTNPEYNFYLDFFVYTETGALNITGYEESTASDHWAFITSPVTETLAPSDVTNLVASTASEYDLYRLNPGNTRWENYKNATHHDGFVLENGKGYLYANKNDVSLTFPGTFNTATEQDVPVSAGYNLVGNPFSAPAYLSQPYYTLNSTGSIITPVLVNNAIMPFTGVIVQAAADGYVHFSTTAPTQQSTGGNKGSLSITLSQVVEPARAKVPELVEGPARNGWVGVSTGSTTLASDSRFASLRGTKQSTLDNAIITFSEGSALGKFYFGSQSANIYIPQNNEAYAIACVSAGTDVARNVSTTNEVPLNFKATADGTYTLTVNPEGVQMAHLHLIDNLTGADVDLLAPAVPELVEGHAGDGASTGSATSYTFTAKTTDYESRFKLVFSVEDGPSTSSGAFAYISNGNIIITDAVGDACNASLQVIDVMGRIVIQGDAMNRVSTSGMMPGVYVLRLINGNDVKVQKMVIE